MSFTPTSRARKGVVLGAAGVVASLVLGWSPATAENDDVRGGYGDDNVVVVTNETDGANEGDGAAEVRFDRDGTVDEYNAAQALANCVDCRTAAVAFQAVVVVGDVATLAPHNEALAANVACTSCLTGAFATQVVVQVDGPARLTAAGRQRLHDLRVHLRTLGDRLAGMDAVALAAEVNAAESEFISILIEELVDAGKGDDANAAKRKATVTHKDEKAA